MPPTKHCHEPQSELISTTKVQPPKVDATVAVYPTGCLGRKTPIAKPPKRTMPGSHKITNELGCRLGEKGPRSGVLSPAPCGKYAKEELNILQLNINGLQNKKIELVKLLQDQKTPQKSPSQDTLKSHVPAKKTLAPTVKAS